MRYGSVVKHKSIYRYAWGAGICPAERETCQRLRPVELDPDNAGAGIASDEDGDSLPVYTGRLFLLVRDGGLAL